MEDLHYTNYAVDAADIWEYECGYYVNGKRDKKHIRELYEFLPNFYLLAKHKPIIKGDERGYDDEHIERYNNRGEDDVAWSFFIVGRKVYSMRASCEIFLKTDNAVDFQRLFILKLCQYVDGLVYLEDFLTHQLKINFKKNTARFQKFLEVSLLQYSGLTDDRIV